MRMRARVILLSVLFVVLAYFNPFVQMYLILPIEDSIRPAMIKRSISAMGWQEYINHKMGISMKIPSTWHVREIAERTYYQDYGLMVDSDKYGTILGISWSEVKEKPNPSEDMVEINGVQFLKVGNEYTTYVEKDNKIEKMELRPNYFIGFRDDPKSQGALFDIADQIIHTVHIK